MMTTEVVEVVMVMVVVVRMERWRRGPMLSGVRLAG